MSTRENVPLLSADNDTGSPIDTTLDSYHAPAHRICDQETTIKFGVKFQ